LNAYLGQGDNMSLPAIWTPEHVQERLVSAIDVLWRTVGKIGPRQHANAWPEMLAEFTEVERFQAERNRFFESRPRPTGEEISLSEHALDWSMRFLPDAPLQRDAIWLWAMGKALGREVSPILRKRKRKAMALIPATIARINAERDRARQRAAYALVGEANDRISRLMDKNKLTIERRERIKREMQARLQLECAGLLPIQDIGPTEAMPGKCLTPGTYEWQRKKAAAAIAHGLNNAGEKVR
jgi:hypothetical protein